VNGIDICHHRRDCRRPLRAKGKKRWHLEPPSWPPKSPQPEHTGNSVLISKGLRHCLPLLPHRSDILFFDSGCTFDEPGRVNEQNRDKKDDRLVAAALGVGLYFLNSSWLAHNLQVGQH